MSAYNWRDHARLQCHQSFFMYTSELRSTLQVRKCIGVQAVSLRRLKWRFWTGAAKQRCTECLPPSSPELLCLTTASISPTDYWGWPSFRLSYKQIICHKMPVAWKKYFPVIVIGRLEWSVSYCPSASESRLPLVSLSFYNNIYIYIIIYALPCSYWWIYMFNGLFDSH